MTWAEKLWMEVEFLLQILLSEGGRGVSKSLFSSIRPAPRFGVIISVELYCLRAPSPCSTNGLRASRTPDNYVVKVTVCLLKTVLSISLN